MTSPIQKALKLPAVEAGQHVERGAALLGGGHHLANVAGVGGGEDLDHLGDDGAGQRAHADDDRQLPPQAVGKVGDEQVADHEGERHRDEGGEPHQRGERGLEVHVRDVFVTPLGHHLVREVGGHRRDDHHDAHGEDPDQQLDLVHRARNGQDDEGDQGHAGHAVGLEAVRRRSHRVAGVVAGAVGDHAGVAGIVLLDLEDDLHEVGADVGDLGEDAAGDAQRRRAQRLADGEADEAGAAPALRG